MALMVQASRGSVRIVPARAMSARVRALAAAQGQTGFRNRGRVGETRPGAGLSLSGIVRGIGRGVGGFLTGGPVGAITSVLRTAPPAAAMPCPSGFQRDAAGGCAPARSFRPAIPFLPRAPSQPTGMMRGEAVLGAFGLPAMVPAEVGTITRNDGTVSPIRRCGPGLVLGRDDLCYPKAILSRRSKFRKHRLPSRPPVTAADAAAIRRAERTKDRVAGLAKDVGLHVTKAPRRRKK